MERVRRLAALWSWLPAFRAVAEAEHLPTAAEHLRVTAPALSRSIRLLEEQLGGPLFDRRGRRLKLNDRGLLFLSVVRDAMRHLDDGLERLSNTIATGPVLVAAATGLEPLVIAAMTELAREHPGLVPTVLAAGANPSQKLRDGSLDACVGFEPIVDPDVTATELGELQYAVYCADAHPLRGRRKLPLAELAEQSFVTYGSASADGWPVEARRTVGMKVESSSAAELACTSGHLLCCLPDTGPRRTTAGTLLHRLPPKLPRARTVFLLSRRPLGAENRATLAVESIERAWQRAFSGRRSTRR